MGKWGKNVSLGEFLSHLVTSFQAASYIAGFTANDCRICLMNKSVYSGPFFHVFLPHMVSYAKFILMTVGGKCKSVVFVLSFHKGSAAHT